MSHLVVLTVTGLIVVAAVIAVLELVTFALVALRFIVRTVRAALMARHSSTSGPATAPGAEGSPGAVAPTLARPSAASQAGGRAGATP
jgi:hypothetical protein